MYILLFDNQKFTTDYTDTAFVFLFTYKYCSFFPVDLNAQRF